MNLSEIPEIIQFNKFVFNNPNLIKISKKYKHVEILSIIYKSDNLKIHGYILKKKNIKKKLPVIIFCRGGNNHKSAKYKFDLKPGSFFYKKELIELINSGKIILFASNIRGSKNSEGIDEFCGSDINDTINLYPIIKKYNIADQNKIGIYGHSRGCTTALLVHKKVKWIKCIVLSAGVYDYSIEKKFRPKMHASLINAFKFKDKDFKKRSAIHWVSKLPKVPILLMHGTGDLRVSPENSLKFSIELYKHKIPYKLVIYPGGDHCLSEYLNEVGNEVILHFKKFLFSNEKIDLTPHVLL